MRRLAVLMLTALAGLLSLNWAAAAPNLFSLDWWTVDGGGGRTGGGSYILDSTIGQPEAGLTISGGSFAVDGGFWGFTAAQKVTNLTLSKVVDNATPIVGQRVTFVVAVSNDGPNDATGVEVRDSAQPTLTFESVVPSAGSYDRATGIWNLGGLGQGITETLTITASVKQSGTITNTATITAHDQPDPDLGDNQASAVMNALPVISIVMTPINPPIIIPPQGGSYQYQAQVTNNSSSVQSFQAWVFIEGPGGVSATVGPLAVTLQPGQTAGKLMTQQVPGQAPAGSYTHTGLAGTYPNLILNSDGFTWEKSAIVNSDAPGVTRWDSDFGRWQPGGGE